MRGSLKDIIFDDFIKNIDKFVIDKKITITKQGKKEEFVIENKSEFNFNRIEITEEEYDMLEKGIISLWEQ